MDKPIIKPANPRFSAGPCAKPPGWHAEQLNHPLIGRSHRSDAAVEYLGQIGRRIKQLHDIPDDYRVMITAASATGAIELVLWNVIGARGVDVFAWEAFGRDWVVDIVDELATSDVRKFLADYGDLPDMTQADGSRDIVFLWNGSTSGVMVPDTGFIDEDRDGLTICDATSAAFGMHLPWDKLDITTFSWQKCLGGEAQHGVVVFSPRALERIERTRRIQTNAPPRALPKFFRLTGDNGRIDPKIFNGWVRNTPSMMAAVDVMHSLDWVESIGGIDGMVEKTNKNHATLAKWVDESDWVDFMADDPATRSTTAGALTIIDPWFARQSKKGQDRILGRLKASLADEQVAYDISAYFMAPPGLRIWTGPTVSSSDIAILTDWLDWAYDRTKTQ